MPRSSYRLFHWQIADTLLQDVQVALRVLFRNRSFTLVAIIAFGLGIGANASVYSTLQAMVLRPLPFKGLDRVLTIGEIVPRTGWEGAVAPANYRDLAQRSQVFERMAAFPGAVGTPTLQARAHPNGLKAISLRQAFFRCWEWRR